MNAVWLERLIFLKWIFFLFDDVWRQIKGKSVFFSFLRESFHKNSLLIYLRLSEHEKNFLFIFDSFTRDHEFRMNIAFRLYSNKNCHKLKEAPGQKSTMSEKFVEDFIKMMLEITRWKLVNCFSEAIVDEIF